MGRGLLRWWRQWAEGTFNGICLILSLTALALPITVAPAFGQAPTITYEDGFTFKNGKPFTVDPFIWAYTPEFAAQMGMPARWITPGLKGVLAAAWRMTTIGNVTCGYDGKAENCRKPLLCQMDIYYDSKLPLPWNYPEVMEDNVWDGIWSTSHLPDISNSKGIRRYRQDPSRPAGIMSSGGELLYGTRRPRAEIVYFDREFLPGIGLIGYVGPGVCPHPGVPGPAQMMFVRPGDAEVIEQGGKAQPLAVMEFPDSYLLRISEAYIAQNRSGADIADRPLGQVADWRGRSYQDIHGFNGQPYVRDPFIWAYSKEFAEKYRMPPQWIEPNLKGALAIAWRMTTVGILTCGLGKRADNCWPPLDCQMDVYFDADAPLPWSYPQIVREKRTRGVASKNHLMGAAFQRHISKYPGRPATRLEPVISTSATLIYGKYRRFSANVTYFDKNYIYGTSVITFIGYGVCPMLKQNGPALLEFYSDQPQGASNGRPGSTEVVHAVELPESLLARLKTAYSAGKGGIDQTLDRLIDDFLKSRR